MYFQTYPLRLKEKDFRVFYITFAVSAVCHLILLIVLIFMPKLTPSKKNSFPVINVNMVTLPDLETALKPGKQDVEKRKEAEKQNLLKSVSEKHLNSADSSRTSYRKISKTSKLITPAPPKIKRSLKKKTFKPSRVVKSALEKIEKKIDQTRPQSVAQAIDGIKNKVNKDESKRRVSLSDKTLATKNLNYEVIRIYQQEIIYHIKKNWVFSEHLAGGSADLESRLVIEIMPNGEINDIFFETKSGNNYLDESAYKAIMKSNPLPPLPKGYSIYHILIGFTPSGIK